MCLDQDWFDAKAERKAQRDAHGVTLKEAEATLALARSTIYPCAVEMALWIYHNWTMAQCFQLQEQHRDYLFRVIERNISYPGVKKARQRRREMKRQPASP